MNIVLKNSTETVEVADTVFACEFNEALVHQVLNLTIARGHTGTRAQKNRSAVRGGGKKPWRQKGTDRARAGTRSSPLWRSGGVIFPASPVKRRVKVNRKMFRGAMRCILSELIRQERLHVIAELPMASQKTKELQKALNELNLQDVLLIHHESSTNLERATKNLPQVQFAQPKQLNPNNLLTQDSILMSVSALKQIEEGLA